MGRKSIRVKKANPQTPAVPVDYALESIAGAVTVSTLAAQIPVDGFTAATDFSISAGPYVDGATITITDAQSRFTAKTNPKPLFWWTADGGQNPDGTLGRRSAWSEKVGGGTYWNQYNYFVPDEQAGLVAPGSTKSVGMEQGNQFNDSAALSAVRVDAVAGSKIYVWRKKYDDFLVPDVWSWLTYSNTTPTGTISAGQTLTGQTSGATGIVDARSGPNGGGWKLLLSRTGGSINSGGPYFYGPDAGGWGEIVETATGSIQVTAPFQRYFNMKTFRIYADGSNNNVGINEARQPNGTIPWTLTAASWTTTFENITQLDGDGNDDDHTVQLYKEWTTDQVLIQNSSAAGVDDGYFTWGQNNDFKTFANRITYNAGQNPLNLIFQQDKVNALESPAITYYDSLYVDDTHHRITVTDSAVFGPSQVEIQIPSAWTTSSATFLLRQGSFASLSGKHLWLVNGDNTPLYIGSFD